MEGAVSSSSQDDGRGPAAGQSTEVTQKVPMEMAGEKAQQDSSSGAFVRAGPPTIPS